MRRPIITPFAIIGALAAVLVWRRQRRDLARVTEYYAALLCTADEQSRRADAANRLKDEFLSTLSHELRTPLNSVLGWARLLASGKLDEAQTARAVQAIERAGWAQSRVIEDLLDLSRIVAGTLELSIRPTAVPPLVESAVESLRPAAEAKRIAVSVTVDPALEPIAADADRLKQVVWNLVSNAIKFTPGGGSVEVHAAAAGAELRITVRDTGIGLTPEVAAHLFERFRQGDASTTREHGGLGLGLGMVRHLVELHGGSVTASSGGNNTGSTFEVRLPIVLVETPIQPPAPPAAPALRGVSVLVVDDDPGQLEFVRETLERHGAIVVTTSSAADAKARVRRDAPDVLLSDLVLPGGDGLEFIRDIRRLDAGAGGATPAAALTALARTEDRRRALSAGYQIHVAKPALPDELVSTVVWLARPRSGEMARRH